MTKTQQQTRRLTALSMFSALAYLLLLVIRLPLIPGLDFLKYDPKDVILVLAGFLYGPLAAFCSTLIVATLELVTVSTTGLIGWGMNVLATTAFVCTVTLVYKHKKNFAGLLLGLVLATALLSAVMLLWNYILTPIFTGWPRSKVTPLLWSAILPFNLLKGGINSLLILALHRPVLKSLASKTLSSTEEAPLQRRRWLLVAMGFALLTLILVVLAWKGKL